MYNLPYSAEGHRGGSGTYLHPGLSELGPQRQLLPDIDVWVVGLLEDFLQLLQLQAGEGGAVPPLLTAGHVTVTLIRQLVQLPLLLLHALLRRHPHTAAGLQGHSLLTLHLSQAIVHCHRRKHRLHSLHRDTPRHIYLVMQLCVYFYLSCTESSISCTSGGQVLSQPGVLGRMILAHTRCYMPPWMTGNPTLTSWDPITVGYKEYYGLYPGY